MATLVTAVVQFLSVMTVSSHIFLILLLAFFLMTKVIRRKPRAYVMVVNRIRRHYMALSLLVSAVATSGSLFFSEIALWDPCKLCWLQRIFMYPQVLIAGIAIWKKDNSVYRYILPMSLIGGSISAYHYYISSLSNAASSGVCSATGPSCLVEYFTEYGYVTIPMMALTAFALITVFMVIGKKKTAGG
jgi:disulfide bond formation protein DsbB